jgi:hypothetical protein
MHQRGTVTTGRTSNTGVDDDERQALQAEGLDPDDPAVVAAIDRICREFLCRMCRGRLPGSGRHRQLGHAAFLTPPAFGA